MPYLIYALMWKLLSKKGKKKFPSTSTVSHAGFHILRASRHNQWPCNFG